MTHVTITNDDGSIDAACELAPLYTRPGAAARRIAKLATIDGWQTAYVFPPERRGAPWRVVIRTAHDRQFAYPVLNGGGHLLASYEITGPGQVPPPLDNRRHRQPGRRPPTVRAWHV